MLLVLHAATHGMCLSPHNVLSMRASSMWPVNVYVCPALLPPIHRSLALPVIAASACVYGVPAMPLRYTVTVVPDFTRATCDHTSAFATSPAICEENCHDVPFALRENLRDPSLSRSNS